jgi:ABC-type multidrug transport system fused ATPase/permease subunit
MPASLRGARAVQTAQPAHPGRGHQRARAAESERYIQRSIDALWRRGDGGHHRAPASRAIKDVDYVYVLDEGHGPYDELRGHEQSRFREMVELQSL